ncbi:IclR family transcriptional regulator [Trinickia fusca]|uniref:IclR family transcriptional regulator n=1 Tax=Trinickia fusca TaxID=2419777 RepID=A0A494XHA3_9BURK|nr:IclR family transcriptional regulator [Trinickia fusca]RKP46933.1 IclR family transcriptional regulator [Trinickia fusca]
MCATKVKPKPELSALDVVEDSVPVRREKPDTTIILSLEKGLGIFEHILQAGRPLKLHEIVEHFGIDKSSAFRFLNTLERAGLVNKHSALKTYTVGPTLATWARLARTDTSFVETARPLLKKLSTMTKQTSHLAVLQNDRVVLIEVMLADNVVSVKQTAGDWDPLYCSAVGKAILAFLPEQERNRMIAQISFKELTPATITTPEMLRVELEKVREEGLAFDLGESNPQLCCIAAPVLDSRGHAVGSIGVSMIYPLFPDGPRAQTAYTRAVSETGRELSAALART